MRTTLTTLLAAVAFLVSGGIALSSSTVFNGAGATFPSPIYMAWAYQYKEANGLTVNYQPIGSGAGIKQIKEKIVDFGASDEPLDEAEIKASGLVQFPLVIGGVVPVVNIPGVAHKQLKLTPELLADIYLGKITNWNSPAITELNPSVKLPDLEITVVYRSDSSGTTFLFTHYLSLVSADWKEKVGTGKKVAWPKDVGGKGNAGVSSHVQQVKGAIGYVEYAFVKQGNHAGVTLKNKDGAWVEPTVESFQAAAEFADWNSSPVYHVLLNNQPGEKSWPITGASFILMYAEQKKPDEARELLRFFEWCMVHGKSAAEKDGYVPLPDTLVAKVLNDWKTSFTSAGAPVWTPAGTP